MDRITKVATAPNQVTEVCGRRLGMGVLGGCSLVAALCIGQLIATPSARAFDADQTTITIVTPQFDGTVFVRVPKNALVGKASDTPCTTEPSVFSLNAGTPGGAAILAAVLAAEARGLSVTIHGSGQCNEERESIQYIAVCAVGGSDCK